MTSQRGVYCVPKRTSMSRRDSQIAPTFSSTHGQSEMAIPQRFYSIVMNSSTHYICTCRTSLLTLPMPPIRSNITHAPSPCTKTLPVGDSAPPLHNSAPPLRTRTLKGTPLLSSRQSCSSLSCLMIRSMMTGTLEPPPTEDSVDRSLSQIFCRVG